MILGTDQTVARVWDYLHAAEQSFSLATAWNLPAWPTEPTQRGIRDYGPLPARAADSPRRIAFIRGKVRLYARDLALQQLAGLPFEFSEDHTALEVVLHAAVGIAEQCGLPWLDGIAAGQAEMADATTYARDFVDHLRRVVFPMARDRRPGDVILGAAEQVNERHGGHMPSEALHQACRKIAHGAAPTPRRR